MAISDHDIINIALEWKNNGRKVAIATLIQTWGSAPRGVGSKLLIDDLGNFIIPIFFYIWVIICYCNVHPPLIIPGHINWIYYFGLMGK